MSSVYLLAVIRCCISRDELAKRTRSIASLTLSDFISPWLARFAISALLVAPLLLQAMMYFGKAGFSSLGVVGCLEYVTKYIIMARIRVSRNSQVFDLDSLRK